MSSPFSINSVSATGVPFLYASFNRELLPPDFKPSAIIQFAVVCLNKISACIFYFFFLVACINDLERECIYFTLRTLITGVRVPTGIPSSTWCTALLNYHFSHEISLLKSTFRAYITNQRKTLEYFWTAI